MTRSGEFLAGVRAQIPLQLAVIPFGLIFGALAINSGIPPLAAQGFSLILFAGSAQFIAVGLIAEGASVLVLVATILIVNLRHVLYSASMAPHFQHLDRRWKMILSWLLTDEAFAVGYLRYRQPEHRFAHWYFLGSGLTLWICWQLSSLAGILLGASIPASLNLDFALPLTFLAILIPTLTDRPSLFTALAAVVLGTLLAGLPYQLGLPLAAMLAVGLGLRLDGHQGAQEGDPKA